VRYAAPFLGLGLLLLLVAGARAEESGLPLTADRLPSGWEMQSEVFMRDEDAAAYAERSGVRVTRVATQYLRVNGRNAQVHTAVTATEDDARTLEASRAKGHGADFLRREGSRVLEVVGGDREFAWRLWALLDLAAREAHYEAHLTLACVESLPDAEREQVRKLLFDLEMRRGDEALEARIREAVADWTFSHSLRLVAGAWTFRPPSTAQTDTGRLARFDFEAPPERCGVPCVEATGDLRTAARYEADGGEAAEALRQPTPRWPAKDAAVASAAAQAVGEAADARAQVLALLRFLDTGVRVVASGTRDGAAAVLARGTGNALERCDLFVTLCRARGLAARQVAGWMVDRREERVWAEVHLPGQGWIPVDPSTTWLGISPRYLPLHVSEDGALPLLHVTRPRVRDR